MCVYRLSPTGSQMNGFVWLKYSLKFQFYSHCLGRKNPTNKSSDGKGDIRAELVRRQRHASFSLALKELRTSAPAERGERGRQMRENYCCQRVKEEEGEEEKRESCLCVSVCAVSVCVLTPAARPASPLLLWRALCSSGPFFFSLCLFPFIPPLHLVPLSLRSSSLPYFSSCPPFFPRLWCRISIARADELHC